VGAVVLGYSLLVRIRAPRERVAVPTRHGFDHKKWVRTVAFSPDGKLAFFGSDDTTVKVWDLDTGIQLVTLDHDVPVTDVAISPSGRSCVAAGADGSLRCWEVPSGRRRFSIPFNESGVTALAVNAHYEIVLTRESGDVEAFNLSHGWATAAHGMPPASGEWRAVSWTKDGTICLHDVARGTVRRPFRAQRDPGRPVEILDVAVSPDARHVLVAGQRNTVEIWDTETGREISSELIK
jgi:WD40 repeat protein